LGGASRRPAAAPEIRRPCIRNGALLRPPTPRNPQGAARYGTATIRNYEEPSTLRNKARRKGRRGAR